MKTFTITIECGNAAMRDGRDIAVALRDVADVLEADLGVVGGIRDENGNTIGRWEIKS